MYIPKSFEETDLERLHQFIKNNSFATLISQTNNEPFASHLPLLLNRTAGSQGTLIGHMAQANPQWQQAKGQNVLTIFQGPHAYISPTWYNTVNVVPTWNYVAVHVYGTFKLKTNRSCLLKIVQQYVDFYEADMPQPWKLDRAEPDFVDGLLDAIVGFEIVIDRIEGKSKLSQNHDESRRKRVIQGLRDGDGDQQIADIMSQSIED